MDAIVERETGLPVSQQYKLGLAIAGHFLREYGMSTAQDYTRLGISKESSAAFYQRISVDIAPLRQQIKSLQSYDASWRYAFNPLQVTPLIRFDATHPERVICPIPDYLLRRVSESLFYDIAGAQDIGNAYGASFETYVGEVLHAIFSDNSYIIDAEREYYDGKNRKDGVDWRLSDASATIFIECKTKRLRHDAKFMTAPAALGEDLDNMAKYIVQHYNNIIDALDGKTHWIPDGKPIFPLIITLENWWIILPDTIAALKTRILARLTEAQINPKILDDLPCTIMSIAEFEISSQVMKQTGLLEYFRNKVSKYIDYDITGFQNHCFPDQVRAVDKRIFADDFSELMKLSPRSPQ
ncbi:hypothetical protein [Ancylobacter sp. SL191]|uniref:hypothetical protein n=1 Tax=Ancylobacter sp. SL191 TaxID=2995166 RepID=UPI0022707231|nr:hypothetical protein [Ancylobacter sp. SL191]WAC27874.1 hypothetical protein OU996_01995 [Ancylobacter sp. SL191]